MSAWLTFNPQVSKRIVKSSQNGGKWALSHHEFRKWDVSVQTETGYNLNLKNWTKKLWNLNVKVKHRLISATKTSFKNYLWIVNNLVVVIVVIVKCRLLGSSLTSSMRSCTMTSVWYFWQQICNHTECLMDFVEDFYLHYIRGQKPQFRPIGFVEKRRLQMLRSYKLQRVAAWLNGQKYNCKLSCSMNGNWIGR